MTLDEAIKHCEEKAEELNKEVLKQANLCNAKEVADCQECAKEHEQLAEWLKDYKRLLEEQRPQGEWIKKVDEAGFISHICSECGAEIEVEDPKDDKFCFNCGAKMKGGENV